MIYYKFKQINNHWFIIFDKDGERKFIYDNAKELEEYINQNKDNIFIGGDNYYYDNLMIVEIINSLNENKFTIRDFPISLDVTQEVIRSSSIKLDTILLNLDKRVFNYSINNDLANIDIEKVLEELIYKINFIKKIYTERKDYFDWRTSLVKEFNLPSNYVAHSKGRLMEDIVSFNDKKTNKIIIDSSLKKYIEELPELQEAFDYLTRGELTDKKISFGSLEADINNQGLKSGLNNVVDTTGENNYLYIDFNSFGPSIIINNDMLKEITDYPERYSELKDRRLALKANKIDTQKYYKRLINSFIDCFSNSASKGYNPKISKSITINGVLIMYLLYLKIRQFGVEVIEVNTDGMIIKTDKINNEEIRKIVSDICENLKMSCDVDVITKIAHKNTANYCVLFEDGSIKKIGIFGKMEDEKMQTNSKRYLSECLLNYYLNNDNDIMKRIMELVATNDVTLFQEIINKSSKVGPLYIKDDENIIELTSDSNRVFVVKDESMRPIYKKDSFGNLVPYNSKVNYELVNDNVQDFDINRLDINYYFNEVKRNIEATSGRKVAMIDIDGTLIKDIDRELILRETLKKLKINLDESQLKELNKNLHYAFINFMGVCKKEKGFGTPENYAIYIKEKCQNILGENYNYNKFAKTLLKVEEQLIISGEQKIEVYAGVDEGITKLRCQGFEISIYTNGFKNVQNAKLSRIPIRGRIIRKGDLSNSYAKSSKKGFLDQIKELKLQLEQDTAIMIGNGTSDLPPKTLNIEPFILLHGRNYSELPKTVLSREDVKIVENIPEVAKELVRRPIRKNI